MKFKQYRYSEVSLEEFELIEELVQRIEYQGSRATEDQYLRLAIYYNTLYYKKLEDPDMIWTVMLNFVKIFNESQNSLRFKHDENGDRTKLENKNVKKVKVKKEKVYKIGRTRVAKEGSRIVNNVILEWTPCKQCEKLTHKDSYLIYSYIKFNRHCENSPFICKDCREANIESNRLKREMKRKHF